MIKKSFLEMSKISGRDDLSNLSVETDLSDVGLCSLNTYEHIYNVILSLILVI